MSVPLPPEIVDLIVDYLYGDTISLKACCLVSKSWVRRTRRHLFGSVEFSPDRWMRLFPDPQNSPTRYTRILAIGGFPALETATTVALPWIRCFRHLVEIQVNTFGWWADSTASLVQLHGLSPTLKPLTLHCMVLPLSEVFNLICSFPLLEDLDLLHNAPETNSDESVAPSTSPRLTGSLYLNGINRSITRRLLSLPDGLRFSEIVMSRPVDDAEPTMELVSKCSDTLKSLTIQYFPSEFDRPMMPPPPFDLSKHLKLEVMRFFVDGESIKWVVATLQTTKPKALRQILIFSHNLPYSPPKNKVREWLDLDRLLARLWTSHSITPAIVFTNRVEGLTPKLFPELTRMGVVREA